MESVSTFLAYFPLFSSNDEIIIYYSVFSVVEPSHSYKNKNSLDEGPEVIQEDGSEVKETNVESTVSPVFHSDEASNALKTITNQGAPISSDHSESETILDFQQASHHNIGRPSSGPNSELRQRRQNRSSSTERLREFSSALNRRNDPPRRRVLHSDLGFNVSSMRPNRPISLLSRVTEGASRNENSAILADITETTDNENIVRLFEMGFTRRHVTMAIRANSGQGGMDNLVSWLLEHPLSDAEVRI